MRVILTADIHIEFDERGILPGMAAAILEEKPDLFVIAGDLSHTPAGFERAIKIFDHLPGVKAVLAGNHDLWCRLIDEHERPTSRQIFDSVLPGISRRHGWLWLEDDEIRIGGVAVCGTIGWYDYGVALANNPSWTPTEIGASKASFNNDGNYMDRDWDDLAFASECEQRLVERLGRLEKDSSVDRIVVVTHVPVFMEQRVHQYGDNSMAGGYFYNLSLGRAVARFSKVGNVISGHTHRKVQAKVRRGGMKAIHARVVGSDYGAPVFEVIEI